MLPDDPILDLLDFEDAQIFAVVDGAMVEDLPRCLAMGNLAAQSLYFDHQNDLANASGPQLIHCPNKQMIVTVRGMFPAEAVVWWVWAEPDASLAKATLFRHLRGLGMVDIPADYPNSPGSPPQWERVLFRHADARVMARVLPVLQPDQRARLFGKAGALILDEGGRLRRALVPAGLPLAPQGFLRLTTEQMDAIAEAGKPPSHQRIVAYLRRHLPHELAAITDEDLLQVVEHSDVTGRKLGIRSEQAHGRWAYLMLLTGGQAEITPEVTAAFREADDPDQCVKDLLTAAAASLRDGAGA